MANTDSMIYLGQITMGANTGKAMGIPLVNLKTHLLAVGGSGSGKTWGVKVVAEGLVARGIPTIVIDSMGDLTGLALPVGASSEYARMGLRVPRDDISAEEWAMGGKVAAHLRTVLQPRILTPCSSIGEQVAIAPVTSRPLGFASMFSTEPEDVIIQADAQASLILRRLGIRVARGVSAAPNHALGVTTEVLLRCWKDNVPLDGPDGFAKFGTELLRSSDPCLDPKTLTQVRAGLDAAALGAQRLWFEGMPFDLKDLLQADAGKTPLIVIRIDHLSADDRPWVIAQIAHAAMNYAQSQGSSPDRPRLALVVDELAGDGGANPILPPGTVRSHPSGEALRRILRQGRHYGLCLLAASQNAGDIDYKSFTNFGTRIVGRLGTTTDVQRVLYGLEGDGIDRLERLIVGAKPGLLFTIPPDGKWERVHFRMLGSVHDTITKDHLRRLYASGTLHRDSSRLTGDLMTAFRSDLQDILRRYAGRIPREHLAAVRQAAGIPGREPQAALPTAVAAA